MKAAGRGVEEGWKGEGREKCGSITISKTGFEKWIGTVQPSELFVPLV